MNCRGPVEEFAPTRLRSDQVEVTLVPYKYRESQTLSNVSQMSIFGSLASCSYLSHKHLGWFKCIKLHFFFFFFSSTK